MASKSESNVVPLSEFDARGASVFLYLWNLWERPQRLHMQEPLSEKKEKVHAVKGEESRGNLCFVHWLRYAPQQRPFNLLGGWV